MAEDAKKPYGDVEYADPGYQSDKKKRYPVDTHDHAKAAWSYINQSDNASAYSSEDLAKVKAKIRSACKKFGIDVSDDTESKAREEVPVLGDLESPIECRAAIAISPTATNEITFLPAGLHAIRPVAGGIGKPIKVLINTEAAANIEQQRQTIAARTGKRVYFDFNHEDGPASFWPTSFGWRDGEGVVAHGEWTASGRRAVEGKDFRAFSPVFHVDDKRKDPSRVVCCQEAGPNMGGLVNDPAFNDLPLWAKNDGSPVAPLEQPANNKQKTGETKMTTEEIAALRAKNQELEKDAEALRAVSAQNADDTVTEAKLAAADAAIRANTAELQLEEVKAARETAETINRKRNKTDAHAAVVAAVKRGAILPKDIRTQEDLELKATADPRFIDVIKAMQGKGSLLGERITPSSIESSRISAGSEDPINVYSQLAKILANSARSVGQSEKAQFASEFGAIYAAEFKEGKPNSDRLKGCKLSILQDAIQAADVTDANLGTLAGTLITQRTLELLKFIFPALTRFTSDFSDQPATFNQTIMTRMITVPNVQTYSTASGWQDSAAVTTDVPVILNNHKGVSITFNENILASTMRRLFDEFAPASAYALAKNIVDAIYALLTDANFTNNTIVASAAFARSNVVDIGVALTTRGVPLGLGNRTMLLWPVAFGNLVKDPALVTFASYQQPRIITEGTTDQSAFVIPVDTFEVYSAPNMPSNNANLVGFAGSRSSLVLATRPPNDYTSVLPGASFGNVQMVTDPDINITVMQVQFVNHTLGTATSRIAIMYGTAAGQTNAGQLIKASAGSGSSR